MSTSAPVAPAGHSHGYVPGDSDVPIQTRSERVRSTDVADFAPISRREEQWKYTTSEQLRGLDADDLTEFLGDIELTGTKNVSTAWVGADNAAFGAAGIPEDRPSAAAWGSAEQAYLITLPANEKLECEAKVTLTSHDTTPSALHVIVEAKVGSEGTVIIDHRGDAVLAENLEVLVGDNAHLTVVSIQDFNKGSVHLSSQFAKLGRNATLKHVVVTLGGDVVRVTPNAVFAAPGSSVELLGVYFADAGQHLEHRLFVDHAQPNCRSRVTYKGALQGKNAHTIWVGDVLIRAAAEGTDTYELNRNLLLTDGARADSVPNLEIETGQIEGAGHASASGRFDDEQLFYLQARGIDETEARRLVVRGFLNEIIQQIGNEEVEARLNAAIETELTKKTGSN
ncbi:MAG: Fe-S cluster assembly protein SufD [Micrococcales bacterium]